ncbi:hypothetical protein AJ79_01711 [Helicocarpus griseus UAMH5409]|uniref:Uncharacterized protein n=1 Tax=Helicocarpus griseus UAMH5409 TaxID=1447875 RepID=A0A2B7XXT9_9EURO|nr:hypothetical protein AJ79_01711 [Helicocarpus griseus UAMH5409]
MRGLQGFYRCGSGVHVLVDNPDLDDACDDPPEIFPSPNADLDYDLDLIRGAVELLFLPGDAVNEYVQAKLMSHLQAGNGDAWIGLLVFLVTNTQSLSLCMPYNSMILTELVNRAAKLVPPFDCLPAFTRLTRVDMRWSDTENSVDSSHLVPFFLFPSMRRISGTSVDFNVGDGVSDPLDDYRFAGDNDANDDANAEGADNEETAGATPADNNSTTSSTKCFINSPVTEMDLTSCTANDGMRSELRLCKKLKSFGFDFNNNFHDFTGFNAQAFACSLSFVKQSLEHLSLTYDEGAIHGEAEEGPLAP